MEGRNDIMAETRTSPWLIKIYATPSSEGLKSYIKPSLKFQMNALLKC